MLSTSLLLLSAALTTCTTSASPIATHEQLPFQPPVTRIGSTSQAEAQSSFVATLREQHDWMDLRLKDHITSLPEIRRVRFEDEAGQLREELVTEGEKSLLVLAGIKFMDVTEEDHDARAVELQGTHSASSTNKESHFPSQLAYVDHVQHLFSKVSLSRMKERLSQFSSFRTRYYRSAEGKRSQAWLLQTVKEIAALNSSLGITVKEFEHPWGQNSILLHMPRASPAAHHSQCDDLVVVGAHQDSTNLLPFLPAPGADDDGSGTTTSLEALTLLVQSGFRPANSSVEFHWYSAEEGGMLGSQALTSQYQKDGKRVKAMLQMDMTAYVKPGTEERVGIIQDFVDPGLTEFVEKLIKHNLDIPSVPTKCGYACSDHSSFTSKGWPSAFAIEATFEDSNTGNIHSGRDTVDAQGFSFDHMAQFVKLVLAFTHELSG